MRHFVLPHDTLIVYLFSLDTLLHEQSDAWLVSQLLVLSISGHLLVWWNWWWNKQTNGRKAGVVAGAFEGLPGWMRSALQWLCIAEGGIWDSLQIPKITHRPHSLHLLPGTVPRPASSCCSPVSVRKPWQVHLPHKFWFGFILGGYREVPLILARGWRAAKPGFGIPWSIDPCLDRSIALLCLWWLRSVQIQCLQHSKHSVNIIN